MSHEILAISVFFHIVSTVVWIGGLILTVILVNPEVNRVLKESPQLYTMTMRLRKRAAPLFNLSLAVLLVTGMIQMSGDSNYDGLLQFDNEWSRVILLKHLAIAGMVLVGVFLQFGVTPALERTTILLERDKGDPQEWARLRRRENRLTWINVILGVLVLAFSAWATTL